MLSTGYQPDIKVFCTPDIMSGHPLMCYPVLKGRGYPVDILDIRLLDSVETWLFSVLFRQVFYSQTTVF